MEKSKRFSLFVKNDIFKTVIVGYVKGNQLRLGNFSVKVTSKLTPKSLVPRAMINAMHPQKARVLTIESEITQRVFNKHAKEFGDAVLKSISEGYE